MTPGLCTTFGRERSITDINILGVSELVWRRLIPERVPAHQRRIRNGETVHCTCFTGYSLGDSSRRSFVSAGWARETGQKCSHCNLKLFYSWMWHEGRLAGKIGGVAFDSGTLVFQHLVFRGAFL